MFLCMLAVSPSVAKHIQISEGTTTKKHVLLSSGGASFSVTKYVSTSLNFKPRSVSNRNNLPPEVTVVDSNILHRV